MNRKISALDTLLSNISPSESQDKSDQKAVSFRVDFNNYVNLCALQNMVVKGTSRNQILNDLLAIGIESTIDAFPSVLRNELNSHVERYKNEFNEILDKEGRL